MAGYSVVMWWPARSPTVVHTPTQRAAPIAFRPRNRRNRIPVMPAMIPLACRSTPKNRATGTILPPCRAKNFSALATRSGGSSTYLPNRASSRWPPWRPMDQPMLSPTTAATNATAATTAMFSRPAPA